ncbi:MAG: hypothetical protein P4L50_00300 [Anaerolineaceae bacterium]|nr:hypothetical protein [Anaerolineaceae bacterium]
MVIVWLISGLFLVMWLDESALGMHLRGRHHGVGGRRWWAGWRGTAGTGGDSDGH